MRRQLADRPVVAVIDDGVSPRVIPDLAFDVSLLDGDVCQNPLPAAQNSHGTICAGIIRAYAPQVMIGSIRVLDEQTRRGNAEHLVHALDWCAGHGINLAQISLGSRDPSDFLLLYGAACRATEAGVTIVAANCNGKGVSAPAFFPNVVGVRADPALCNFAYRIAEPPNQGVEFLASARHTLSMSDGLRYVTPIGNSYAAPVITGAIASGLMPLAAKSPAPADGDGWSEWQPDELRYYEREATKADIPILYFAGARTAAMAAPLAEAFLRHGYLPLLISGWPDDQRRGFRIATHSTAGIAGLQMAEAMGADLLFLAGVPPRPLSAQGIEIDILLSDPFETLGKLEYRPSAVVAIPYREGKPDVPALYERVYSLLSDNEDGGDDSFEK